MVTTLDDLMACSHTCKTYNKLEHEYLSFQYEYNLTADQIDIMEENDVDLTKYQTKENKIKEDIHEKETFKAKEDHILTCEENYCKTVRSFREGIKC